MNGEPDLYIGGQWRHASDGGHPRRSSTRPTAASPPSSTRRPTPTPATPSLRPGRRSTTGPGPRRPSAERAALLDRIADLLQRDKEDLSRLETRDTGKTLVESRIDIDDVTSVFRYYAKLVGVRGRPGGRRRRSRPSSAAWCASPSASACSSRRGTTRCCRCRGRSRPRSAPAARWSPSPARSRRCPPSPSCTCSRRRACPAAWSTSCRAAARSSAPR